MVNKVQQKFFEKLKDLPSKKVRSNNKTMRDGELFFEEFINVCGLISHKIPLEHDYGEDYYVKIVDEDERLTGEMAIFQIKSGKTFFRQKSSRIPYAHFLLPKSERNLHTLKYWNEQPLPVFLFFYYKKKSLYSIINVKTWLANPDLWSNDEGLPVISSNLSNSNNSDEFSNFYYDEFLYDVRNECGYNSILKVLEKLLNSDDELDYDSFSFLINHPRILISPLLGVIINFLIQKNFLNGIDILLDQLSAVIFAYNHKIRELIEKNFSEIANKIIFEQWKIIISRIWMLDFKKERPGDNLFFLLSFVDKDKLKIILEKILVDKSLDKKFDSLRVNAYAIYLFGSDLCNIIPFSPKILIKTMKKDEKHSEIYFKHQEEVNSLLA
ncbi:DUF4365 domain-containing protein [Candidatus Lokiarchaeum ossiferum]